MRLRRVQGLNFEEFSGGFLPKVSRRSGGFLAGFWSKAGGLGNRHGQNQDCILASNLAILEL